MKNVWGTVAFVIIVIMAGFWGLAEESAACKALAVAINSENYGYNREVKQGIDKALQDRCEVTYFYLDSELNPGGVEAKAAEAYALYQELQPDGVFAIEETVHPLFVEPYLKNKVDTPVIFVGMFSPPETYGYPASNVNGVLSHAFFKESLAFIRQLDPSIQSVGFVCNDAPAAVSALPVIKTLYEEMGVLVPGMVLSNNAEEIYAWVDENNDALDALFVCPILGKQIVGDVLQSFPKPTFSCWKVAMEYGVLAGVIESGEEIGQKGAEMFIKVLEGEPISELPFTAPEFGRRVINVNTLKALGLKPSRRVLTGVELIR